jgi:4-hydroxy-tetrahydrodipicolinate synthase
MEHPLTLKTHHRDGRRRLMNEKLKGNHCLIVTPFDSSGDVDEASTKKLIDFLISQGVHGILGLGTTGEFFLLSSAERERFMKIVLEHVSRRVPVGFCCGHSGTDPAIKLSQIAEKLGADYVMITPPYYFVTSRDGIKEHFKAIAQSIHIPVMVYDGGGNIEIPLDLLSEIIRSSDNITSIKISVPSPLKVKQIYEIFGEKVVVICGMDALTLLMLSNGAQGLTLGVANVLPKEISFIYKAYQEKKDEGIVKANKLFHEKVLPLVNIALGVRTEYIQCFKYALVKLGIIKTDIVRKPFLPMDKVRQAMLEIILRDTGIVK